MPGFAAKGAWTLLFELVVILVLVVANGVLAGAEIAIVALRRTRLQKLVEENKGGARAVADLRAKPESFLATVQVGITVIGATAGAFGGATLAKELSPWLARVRWLEPWADGVALVLVVGIVSYLSLVVGELVPKSLALRAAEPYALFIGRPLKGLSAAARPAVWFLTASSNIVLRLFGDRTSFTESRMSSDELQQILEEAGKAGSLDPRVGDIASRALDFGELLAADVMVPRNKVTAVDVNTPLAEVRRLIAEDGHARLPVYDGNIDDIVGMLMVRDIFARAADVPPPVLRELVRPPVFVPDAMRAVDVLQDLQGRRTHLAIVVDERGGVAGIVTMEDLIEELVGEIFSEDEAEPAPPIRKLEDGTVLVLGTTPVRDVNRELDLDLAESDTWNTIAGLCIVLAGHIPVKGERLQAGQGVGIEIIDATQRRVRLVKLTLPEPPREDGERDDGPPGDTE